MEIKKQIQGIINSPLLLKKLFEIRRRIFTPVEHLDAIYCMTPEPVPFDERLELEYEHIKEGDKWGGFFDCAWFNFKGSINPKFKDEKLFALIDIDGEGCIFDDHGVPIKGLTKIMGFSDYFNSVSGKKLYELPPGTIDVNLWVDTGNNGFQGKGSGASKLKMAEVVMCREDIYDLYFDYLTLYLLMTNLSKQSDRYRGLKSALKNANKVLSRYSIEEVKEARSTLNEELSKASDDQDFQFYAVGHAHLDLAWLWPIRETVRKATRTFSNQLDLIIKSDDYIFGASQPQQFEWMKDLYPGLYDKIKEAVDNGRLELQGGMWAEADTNVTGAESLVRQMLYGKKFFKDEFRKDMRILWLPDVFGFSGALPQIIKKSGMDYFLTIKLSWNEHNRFPYHSFVWEGIDDSKVLVHMPPEGTYNSDATPNSVMHAYNNYKEKSTNMALIPFGVGDGGGGPGEVHYELVKRQKDLLGSKKVKMAPAIDFFDKLNAFKKELPHYKGELYLEKHQGTLTTQAKSKLYNRQIEMKLHNLELLGSYATSKGYKYPKEQILKIWKEVLLYQFHDIIPGSSITRVYWESHERYLEMMSDIDSVYDDIVSFLAKDGNNSVITAFNALQYERDEYIYYKDSWYRASIKPFSTCSLQPIDNIGGVSFGENYIENDKLKVVFDENGSISSYYDKVSHIECVGDYLNRLTIYQDKKLYYNAWDIDIKYTQKNKDYFNLVSSENIINGPSVIRRNIYKYNKSTLTQDVILYVGKDYLEFKTEVDWHEKHKMLRADFRPSIYSDDVLCDIQWGNLKRTTKTDTPVAYAQYEICAHKYVDVTDDKKGYGFALINNCKYGHRVKDGIISLNLLRSTVYPDKTADRGIQSFTYVIYTHKDKAFNSDLVKLSYIINNPLVLSEAQFSINELFSIDNNNIILETIKLAEDNDNIILRLYEHTGKSCKLSLKSKINHKTAYETDMLENKIKEIDLESLRFKPYEIKTVLLER